MENDADDNCDVVDDGDVSGDENGMGMLRTTLGTGSGGWQTQTCFLTQPRLASWGLVHRSGQWRW